MTTELPEELQKALEIVGGQRWPEGDEDGLRRISAAWADISTAIDTLEAAVERSATTIGTTMRGEFSDAYARYTTEKLRPLLQDLRKQVDGHSELAKNTAADIQYAKINIIVQLVMVAATLAFSWLPGIGQAITAAAAATARAVIAAIFRTVMQNIIAGAVLGTAFEVGLDAVIQGMQMLTGVRTDWNEDFTKGAAVGGALGGAMGGAMGGLVHGVGKFTKGGIDKTIDEGKIVRGPAAESADGILGQGAKNFLDTTGGKLAFDVGNVAGQGVGGFTADGATNAALGQEEWNPFSFTSSMVDGLEGRGDGSADDGSDTDALGRLKSFGGGDLPDAALPQTTSSPDGTYAEDTPDGGIRTEWSGQDGGNTATPGLPDKQNVPVAPAEDGPTSGTNQSTGTDVPMASTGQNSTPPSNTNDSDVTVDGAPPNGTDRNGDPGATTPTPTPEIKSIAGDNTTGWNNTGRNGDWSPDNVEHSPVDVDVADSGVDGSVPETPTFTPEINAVTDNGIDGRTGVTQEPGSFGGTTPSSSDTTGTVTSNSSGDTPTTLASAPPPAETTESAPEHTNTDAVPDNVEHSPVDVDVADSGVDGSVPETPTFTPEINAVTDNGIDGRTGVTQEPGSFGGTTPSSSDTTGTVTSNSSGDTPTTLASAPPPAETTESAPEHTNTDAVRDHDDSSSFTPHPMDEGSVRGDGEETTSTPRQHGTFDGPAPQTSTPDHSGGAGTGNAPVPDIATHQADPTPESAGPAQLSQDTSTGPNTWSDDAAPRTDTDTPPTEQVNGPRFDGNTASAGTDSDTANTGAPPIAPVSVGQGTNGTPGTSGAQGTPPSTTGRATSTDGGPNTSPTKQPSGSAPSTTGKPSRVDTESAPHNAPTRINRGAGPATTSRDTPSTPPSRQPAPSTGEHTTTRAGRTTDPNAGSAAEHTPDTHPPHPEDLHSESSAPSQPHETTGQPGPTPELGPNQHHQAGPTIHHHNGIQSTPLTELHGYHGVKPDHYNAVLNQIQRPTTGAAGNEDSDWKGWYLGEKPDHAAAYSLNDDGHSGAVLDFELPHHVTVHTIPPELSPDTDALKAALKRHFGIDDDTPLLDGLADQNSVLRISENSDGDHELIVPWLLAQNGTARHNSYATDSGRSTSDKPRGWDRWVPLHSESSAPSQPHETTGQPGPTPELGPNQHHQAGPTIHHHNGIQSTPLTELHGYHGVKPDHYNAVLNQIQRPTTGAAGNEDSDWKGWYLGEKPDHAAAYSLNDDGHSGAVLDFELPHHVTVHTIPPELSPDTDALKAALKRHFGIDDDTPLLDGLADQNSVLRISENSDGDHELIVPWLLAQNGTARHNSYATDSGRSTSDKPRGWDRWVPLHSESSAPSQPHETTGQPGPTPELGPNQHHQAGPTIHHHNGIQSTPLTELHGYHGVKPDHYNAVLNQIQRPTTGAAGNEDSDWKGWYLGEKPDHAAAYSLNDDGHSGAVLDFELPHHVTVHTIPPELSPDTDALKAALKRHFGIDDDTPLLDGLADQNSVLRISENSDGDHELIVPWLLAQNGTARHNSYATDSGRSTSDKPRGWDRWVPLHSESSAPSQPHETTGQPGPTPELGPNQHHQAGPTIHHHNGIQSTPLTELHGYHGVKPDHYNAVLNQIQRPTTGAAGNEDSDWKGWYLGEKPDHAAAYSLNDDGHSGAVLDFELPHHVTVHTIPPELSPDTDALKAALKRHFGIDDDTPLLDGLADQNSVLRISENSDGDHELIVPWLLAQNGTARHNSYATDSGRSTSDKPRGWDRWVPTNHTDSSAPHPEGSAAHEQDPATSDTQRPQAHHSRITSPAEWGDRRDTAIATHHRSERFDPAANPLIDKGLVQGAVTRIDYDVRRFEVAPDNWVREFTVKLDLVSPNDAVSPQARQELGERVRSHIDEHINQRHRLPTSDDQLHVNLEFDTAKWDDAPAGHPVVKVHDSTGVDRGDPPKQLTWDTTHPSGPLVHEVMHFLGLGEGYRDPDLLLQHPDRPGVMGTGAWDARPTLTQDDLHTLEDIADSGPVIRDHPLTEPGPSAHGETGTGQRHDLPDSQVPADTPDDPTPGPGDPYGESSAPRRPTDLPPVPEEFELETLQRRPENGERNPADPAAEHTTNGDAAHQQEPRSFTDEVPAEFDRRMHDRSEQPKVIGEPDGKSVRETASELLGSREGSRDEQVEDFVRIALSDENLQKNFHRMLDGGYVMDFGSRPGHRATEVTVELTDLGEPRNEGVHKDNMDFENEQKRERNSSTARGALGTLSFGGRVPILNFLGQVQVKGLVNSRESGMSTETSHSTKTKLTEEDVARNSTEHDAKYKITVRTRDGRLGDDTVSRSDSANGHVKLAWGQRDTANAKSEVNIRDISTDSIRHAQFSGLDNVYRKVADELGLKKNDPGGRELNEWLQSLGKDVLAGPVRETFTFNNSSRPTEIVLGIDKDVQAHRLPDVGGTAEHTTTDTAKRTTTQANTRDRGVDAVVGGGDITGANGALAGLNVAHSRSTRNESSTTDEHESRSVETHKGPFTKHQLDLKYLAQVTTRSEPGKLLTADGSATLWSSQHRADPAPDPGSAPAGVDRHRFPDHIDAQHRIPDETVQGITGPVLTKLRLEGLLPDDELPRIRTKFDDFVREHARDLTSGDGIRFPLSALHSGAPDVFVRGNLNRADAKYLGTPRDRTLGGAVGSTHENVGERVHSKDTSVGALATAALTIPGSPPPSQHNHYPEAYAKRNFSRGSAEKSTQQAGYERSLDSTRKIHQFRYPTEFEVRIGGRWSDRPGIAEWRGPNDDESTHTLSGDVEVAAPEKSGKRFDDPAPEQPQEHSGWNKDDPPGPLERTGHLPAGFELESLKPVPGLLTTITEMLNAAPETKQRRWAAVPFVGNKPVSFDEHRGSDLFRPRDKHHNALDEHNTALDAVEAFASTDFRTAQFELTALHRDTGQFRSHNTGSLFGNRELSAQVDLSTRLGTPRIVSREDDHGFEGTKEHTSTELGSEERKNTNYETGVDASQYITTSPTTMAGPTATASAKYTDSDTVSGNSASAKNTSSSSRSERGYLVRFDARHEVRTSVQHTTQNYLRLLHHGDVAEETRWVDVPGAVEVWVPASEMHQIGELTGPEIEKLDSADADRYHQQNRIPGASDAPEAPGTSDASDAPSGQRTGSQPVARSEGDPADSTLRPPQNVGRGSGRVELHRLGAGKELVEGIEQRLDQWSRENGRPKTSAKLTDIAREALGKPVPDRQPKVEKFDAINDRLVRDVLGPTVSRHGFNTALGEMLNGGRPMYLEGSTAFGKVEQLVVLRARTGDGQYYQSLSKHATTDSHETKTHDKRGHHKGWDIDGGLGGANYTGIGNPVASLQRVGLTGGYTDKHGSELTNESSNTVTTKTGNATSDGPESTDTGANKPDTTGTSHSPGRGVQFLHDLTIDMEVYPYARPGTYSTPLAKMTPALAPRRFGEPFKASFSLPDATRSTVDIRETISTDGSASDPVKAVSGSLRQRQSAQRVELGWPENTKIQARPFPAPGLHEKLDELVHGDSNTESPPRPVLNPSPAFRLHAATTVHQLRSHLREATSKNGYSISLASGSLDKVRITADLTSRELIRTIDEGELSRSTTDKQELTPDAQREGRIGITTSVDFREPSIQEAPMRSNQGVIATSQSATPWNSETKHTITSTKENPDNKTDGARYLVRVTPEWTITPTYRAKKAPPEWGQPLRTGPDEPIMLEVDRDGLELLGLHDPPPERAPIEEDPPPERAPIEEDPPPESDPIEDDWPVYARELLDTEQQSSDTALADFLAPTRAPQHAEADGGKRPDQ